MSLLDDPCGVFMNKEAARPLYNGRGGVRDATREKCCIVLC